MARMLVCVCLAAASASPTAHNLKDVATCIDLKTKKMAPCGPGNQVCPPGLYGANTPQFHVKDASCGENDPNGPSYDPVHGVYHLHYQNHVGLHGGRTYGHAVSRDFVHWAHMPDSIWNDQPYDSSAIYTGSASIVDGKVVQVYPGLCSTKNKGCPGGTNLCIAKPANPADPLQTNWSKDATFTGAVNPIVNATGRDPSTAWKTKAGEYRLTTFDTIIYASMDFNTWYKIGPQPNFPHGECPSFFPLPPTTPGAGPAPNGAKMYSHVHKASHGGDWMQVGNYIENGVKQNGNWTAEKEVKIDMGRFYASKDFWDPVKKRRINYGWAQVPPSSTQTLPRSITWNPELQQLVYSPVAEQDKLRGDLLSDLFNKPLAANVELSLGAFPGSSGNQSEVEVIFEIPSAAATFGVIVMGGATTTDSPTGGTGTFFYVNYSPAEEGTVDEWTPHTVQVGAGPPSMIEQLERGEKVEGGTTDTLKLSPNDKTITIRVYVDNTFSEAYWQGGRVAMTITTPATPQASMAVKSTAPVTVESAKAYKVRSIWVSPEQVLVTPRLDGKRITGREGRDE